MNALALGLFHNALRMAGYVGSPAQLRQLLDEAARETEESLRMQIDALGLKPAGRQALEKAIAHAKKHGGYVERVDALRQAVIFGYPAGCKTVRLCSIERAHSADGVTGYYSRPNLPGQLRAD